MATHQQSITDFLKKKYFWDIEITPGRPVSKRLVVDRIFSFGSVEEMSLVIKFYGRKEIEDILTGLNYLDPKTLNFVSKFFRRPKKDFKCFTRKQLTAQHWDY